MPSITSRIDAPQALSYRLHIGHEPLNRLVSEIFSIKDADRQIAQTRRLIIRVA